MQGGSASLRELGVLLSPLSTASPDAEANGSIQLYRGVTYLMPLAEARTSLGLNSRLSTKNKVVAAGFPRDSLSYHRFNGIFDGHYNQLDLVTDKADQVVSVQLVAETPRKDMVRFLHWQRPDWSTYNFIQGGTKALTTLRVQHETEYQTDRGTWARYDVAAASTYPRSPPSLIRIETVLVDPNERHRGFASANWKPLQAVSWYIPAPLAALILQCVDAAASRR